MRKLVLAVTLTGIFAATRLPPQAEAFVMPEANIRFINRLTVDATVSANGAVIYRAITPGSVTGWTAIRDTITTFTLSLGESDTVRATTSAALLNGSHYTVAATRGSEGGVVLAVLRDNGPGDTTNVARPRPTTVGSNP